MYNSDEIRRTNKVLIVDDSEPNRILLQAILAGAGYESDMVADGLECIAYCMEQVPQMVLLDIMMPKMDGIEACKSLRKVFGKEDLPIILVTTKSEGPDIAHGLQVGANDYVTKPVDRHILLARIDNCLSLIETQQALLLAGEQTEKALMMQRVTGDALTDAIAVHDHAGELIYANKALKDLCGGERPQRMQDLFHSLYGGVLETYLQQKYELFCEDTEQAFEEEVEHASEEVLTFHVTSRPLRFQREQKLRMWMWRDLTHVKNLERKMNQRIRLETVGLFASGVAHNFNNILGGILGASELLKRSEDQRVIRCSEIIQKGVRGGMQLTRKMSALLRKIETKEIEHPQSLSEVLQEILDQFDRDSSKTLQVSNDVPGDIYLDLARDNVKDIIENIISNAVDAIQDQGEIVCRLHEPPKEDNYVTLSIKDTGVGMDNAMLERIFEPFFSTKNLDEANSVSVEGNGLGLWNVYHLVKMYDGDILVESSPGSGTEVQLKLPIRST